MADRITAYIAPGEANREKALRAAIEKDKRFKPLEVRSDLPVDVQFWVSEPDESGPVAVYIDDQTGEECSEPAEYIYKILNIELKEPSDFVQSVLSGHLYDQILSIRESKEPGCVVILGDLGDISDAIKQASKLRAGKFLRGAEAKQAMASNYLRCKSFRKRAFLNGVPVFYQGDDSGFFDSDDQFQDILELAHDYLLDGEMMGFRQRPAEGERELTAATCLTKGIGPETWRAILEDYQIGLFPRNGYARPIEEFPGVGKVRASVIRPLIRA